MELVKFSLFIYIGHANRLLVNENTNQIWTTKNENRNCNEKRGDKNAKFVRIKFNGNPKHENECVICSCVLKNYAK